MARGYAELLCAPLRFLRALRVKKKRPLSPESVFFLPT